MKKLKFLPSVLMLVLCLAVLAVGIYAIKPTQNTIEGTITIGATNPHVIITAYKTAALNEDGTEATANKLVGPLDARAGAKLQIAEALEFDVEEANTLADVDDVVIVLKIENKSNKELGAYFYEGLSTDVMPEVATADNVRTSYLFKQNAEDADEDAVINTSFTGYSRIAPYVSDEDDSNITYMQITFKLNQFKEYTSNFNFPLNIETYNEQLDSSDVGLMLNVTKQVVQETTPVSKDTLNPTTFAGDKSKDWEDGSYSGFTNLLYAPVVEALLPKIVVESTPEEKFSFNMAYTSELGEEYISAEDLSLGYLFYDAWIGILVGNYDNYEHLDYEGLWLDYDYDFTVNENTITIYETENTSDVTEFCLCYVSFDDLEISLSTPDFEEGEKLEILKGEYIIRNSDNIVHNNESLTQEYIFEDSTNEAIDKKASITTSSLTNIPEDAKVIYIYTDVPKGSIYLIDEDLYNNAVSAGAPLSEIIQAIDSGNITEVYNSAGAETEDGGTYFEIPFYMLNDGDLDLTSIILSDSEALDVNYTVEFSDEINPLIFTLVSDDENGDYYVVSGIVSNKITEVSVPATYKDLPVKGIDNYAFSAMDSLAIVDLTGATNLTHIGDYAFSDCTTLTNITIPETVTSIGSSAFNNCDGLTNITIPSLITTISSRAFYSCSGLTSIDLTQTNNLVNIGDYAFSNCQRLTSITVPETVTSIGASAFNNCVGLTEITLPFAGNGSNYTNFGYIFGANSYSSHSTMVPSLLKNVTLTKTESIGSDAFRGCSNLTSITIPENVTSLENNAFYDCTSLNRINIPTSVTNIGASAFKNCTSLTEITIPESVKKIGTYAFENCTGLTEINYNATTLTTAPTTSSIFYKAGNSETGITVNIGANVTEIPSYLFYGNSSSYAPKIATVNFADQSVCSKIGGYSFYNCSGLISINIPSIITSIGSNAFYSCAKLATANLSAATSLTSIEYQAFYGCTSLIDSITIPENFTSIGLSAFYNCTSLTEINYNATSLTTQPTSSSKIFYNAGTNGTGIIVNIGANVTKIPDYLFHNGSSGSAPKITTINFADGSNCSSIGAYAFEYCSSLNSINVPDTVTSIGDYSFRGCSSLTSINIPEGVTGIGASAFNGCNKLTSITIPQGVTQIGDSAFKSTSALTTINYNAEAFTTQPPSNSEIFYYSGAESSGITVNIGANVTDIPNYLFYGYFSSNAPNIKSVIFAENGKVVSIGQYAFQNVISLTEITIPLSVTSINTKAFYGCTNLATVRNNSELDIVAGATTHGYVAYYATSVIVNTVTEGNVVYWVVSDKKIAIAPTSQDVTEITLANDCTSIKNNAFENVVGITSITIPASVTSIGDNAFYGCTNLATVYNNSELDIVAGATTHGYVAYYATVVYKNGEISSKFVTEDNVIYVVTETEKIAMGPTSLDVTTIALAEDCTSVKEEAFKDCASLTSVTISPSVTSIGNRAFKGCSSLNMYTNTIEDWLKMSFGRETFNNAYNLYVNNSLVTDLIIPNSVTEINANNFRYCNISTLTISQGIISIGQDAFSMCRSLTDIVLPSSLKTIGQESFSGCTALTKAIIPEGVETIEYWAFSSCAAITELTIPTTVKSIGAGAFGSCLRLTTINYNATSATLVRNPNHSNSGFSRAGQNGTGITLNIAANVQIIPEHLFYESSSTFATKITKVIFADGSNCKTIGDSAFWGCANLKSLILPASLTTIGVSTFRATGLTSITIPSGVTELGDCAFYGCSSLASVTIESTETSTLTIGEYVFANCTSLTSIIIPSSVTSIGDSTFGGCSSLATITIKEGTYAMFKCKLPYTYTLTNEVKGTNATYSTYFYFERESSGDNVYTKQ